MKRVLMVCSSFYPQNNPRAVQCSELYKGLSKRGYCVDVCYVPRKQLIKKEDVDQLLCTEGISESSFMNEVSGIREKISRLVCYFIGQKGFYVYYNWMKKNIDFSKYNAVLSIAAPFYNNVLVARMLARSKVKINAISDNGDPFYDNSKHSGIVKFIQKKTFSKFKYVCYPTSAARKYYLDFIDENKLMEIPQGRNFEQVITKSFSKNDVPTFAYAGCFFADIRNPENFLNMLLDVKKEFRFILFTETKGYIYENILLRYKEMLGEKIQIKSFLPRQQCIYELSGMDFLVNFENMSSLQSPSKLIDYSLTGRPIYSIRQDRVNMDEFEKFLYGNYEKRTLIDIEKYNIDNVVQKYIDLIESIN